MHFSNTNYRTFLHFSNTLLPRLAAADGLFLEEPHFIAQSVLRVEDILLALQLHFVGGNLVDAVKLQRLHRVVAILCW